MTKLHVSEVHFSAASTSERATGLLGFVRFVLGGLVKLDGVAVRRTRRGNHVLSFPVRHDAEGRQHPVVRPVNDLAREDLEAQILRALGLRGPGGGDVAP